MKKLVSMLLVIVLVVSASISVAAADSSTATQSLHLNMASAAIKVNGTVTLAAALGTNPTQAVTWSTSDATVAAVSSNGAVTGIKLGIATVKAATADGLTASCIVHVVLKGIDVSSWQGTVSWSSVKASGIDFAMIRTGYGSENWAKQTDSCFAANYDGATKAGLKVGVYHYSYATTVDMAVKEANMCLSILNGRKLDYPVAYDVEDNSQFNLPNDLLTDMIVAFCNTIQKAGYKPAIYMNPYMYYSKLTSSKLDPYDKWIAHWFVNTPNFDKPFTMWQFSDNGTVPGTTGAVDLDYSYRDYSVSDLAVQPVAAVTPAPTPVPVPPVATAPVVKPVVTATVKPAVKAAPVKKPAPAPVLKAGVRVKYTGYLYATSYGGKRSKRTVSGTYKVLRVINGRKYGVLLPSGWVAASSCKIVK